MFVTLKLELSGIHVGRKKTRKQQCGLKIEKAHEKQTEKWSQFCYRAVINEKLKRRKQVHRILKRSLK